MKTNLRIYGTTSVTNEKQLEKNAQFQKEIEELKKRLDGSVWDGIRNALKKKVW